MSDHIDQFDVTRYGAPSDGVTDAGPSIQATLNDAALVGGTVLLPAKSYYLASGLQWPANVAIEGLGQNPGNHAGQGTQLRAAPGIDVLTMPGAPGTYPSGLSLRNVFITGGARHIVSLVRTTYVDIERVTLYNPSQYGIYTEGAIEEWTMRDVLIQNPGVDGFHVANVEHASNTYIDKSSFYDVVITGAGRDGWHIESETSNNVTWYTPTMNFNGRHGFYGDCGVDGWVFVNTNTESNGTGGKTALTSGSIVAGSTALTVADGSGIANGDPITVAGAGLYLDLQTTVVSGGGTTSLVLQDAAVTSALNVEVTNRSCDDFCFNGSIHSPQNMTWIGGSFGHGDHCRYAINGAAANVVTVTGVTAARPVYVLDQLNSLGGNVYVRQVNDLRFSGLRSTLLATPLSWAEFPWTMVPSPPGKDTKLTLRDSADNGTGTYGNVEVRRRDQRVLFNVQGSNGALGIYGPFYAGILGGGMQNCMAQYMVMSGVPSDTLGADDDICWVKGGRAGTTLYQKRSGHWTPIL